MPSVIRARQESTDLVREPAAHLSCKTLPRQGRRRTESLRRRCQVRRGEREFSILRNADQTVNLSWTGAGVLEQTESLTALNWQPAPTQANPQILSMTDPMKFFRVKTD